jgi:hypothetical protein
MRTIRGSLDKIGPAIVIAIRHASIRIARHVKSFLLSEVHGLLLDVYWQIAVVRGGLLDWLWNKMHGSNPITIKHLITNSLPIPPDVMRLPRITLLAL